MPDLDITLFSDEPPKTDAIDSHRLIENPNYDFSDKMNALPRTPYDRTLFLDSDIYVNESVPELFEILDRFEIALTLAPHQGPMYEPAEVAPEIFDGRYAPMAEFNTGLFSYRLTDEIKHCFDIWESEFDDEAQPNGQPSFMAAAYKSDVRICPVPREYNYLPGMRNGLSGEVRVFHNRLEGGPTPAFKDIEPHQIPELVDRVNAHTGPRVTYARDGGITQPSDLETRPVAPLPVRFYLDIQEQGFIGGMKKWSRKAIDKIN